MTVTDLWTFHLLAEDIAPDTALIEGRVFLNRGHLGRTELLEKIDSHADLATAQYWMNLAPIDDLLDAVCGGWDMADPAIDQIADLYRRSWIALVQQRHGAIPGLSVELLKDEETGDVILQLKQVFGA